MVDVSRVPASHTAFLRCALPVLEGDPRIVGVAAGGSWISGEMDEFSDLDLVVVVSPPAYAEVEASRLAIASSLGSLLAGFTGEHVGEPRLIICLYEGPLLHVDLKFVSLDHLAHRVEDPVILWERDAALTRAMATRPAVFPMPDPQWIEDRFWTWVHYCAAKLGRGELFEVVNSLGFLQTQVLGPLAAVAGGHLPRGMRRLEQRSPSYLPAFERTLAVNQPKSCADALFGAVQLYRDLRDKVGGAALIRRLDAERASIDYLDAIAKRVAGVTTECGGLPSSA
jgi:hypothetical protein